MVSHDTFAVQSFILRYKAGMGNSKYISKCMWATPSNNSWDPKIQDQKIRGRYLLGLRSSGANVFKHERL